MRPKVLLSRSLRAALRRAFPAVSTLSANSFSSALCERRDRSSKDSTSRSERRFFDIGGAHSTSR
eukprot:877573-Pleurochrysis_carterae.AAC.1